MIQEFRSSNKCSHPRHALPSCASLLAHLHLFPLGLLVFMFLTGCYTLAQGVEQAKLLSRRVPIEDVLREQRDTPERLKKLQLVPQVLRYAEDRLSLTPGSSYRTYISLDRPALSYVVQAADKRKLKLKTWWFPVVGSQPYLGFFDKKKAEDFQKQLINEGYDTSMGGVQAFSLLGYFPDPVYSSMLDGNNTLEFTELLFHEILHRTLYVPDAYTFNENLAEFVSRHAMVLFLKERPELFQAGLDPNQQAHDYIEKTERLQKARQAFGEFLTVARSDLSSFYDDASIQQLDLPAFLKARIEHVTRLNERYLREVGERVKGTHYVKFFEPERFNNARFLGASVYQARQEPFARLLEKTGTDLAKFMKAILACVSKSKKSEHDVWVAVETCGG